MKYNSGVTLLELSIVLLVLGSLVAIVTVGSKLQKQADLRKIIANIETYDTAVVNFLDNYRSLPGDFAKAYDAFGTKCSNTGSSDAAKCNGNGDNKIESCASAADCENTRFWQHLYLAEILPVSYDGISANSSGVFDYTAINETNSPFGVGIGNYYVALYLSGTGLNFDPSKNVIGMLSTTQNTNITPSDARSIDLKYDDGFPYTGKLYSYDTNTPSCVVGDLPSADYNVSDKTASCNLYLSFSVNNS